VSDLRGGDMSWWRVVVRSGRVGGYVNLMVVRVGG